MKDSLKYRLILFCAVIMVDFLLVIVFIMRMDHGYEKTLRSLIEEQSDFTGLYTTLTEADYNFRMFSIAASEENKTACESCIKNLNNQAEGFAGISRQPWSDDLNALIHSYTQEAAGGLLSDQVREASAYTDLSGWYQIIMDNHANYSEQFRNNIQKMYQAIERNQRAQLLTVIGILIMLFIGQFVIIVRFAGTLLDPVEDLTQVAVSNMNEGTFQLASRYGEGELKVLCETFNRMILRIEEQVNKLKDKAKIEKELHESEQRELEAEMKTLSSRINSHFLFNTLMMLSEMAWEEKAGNTSEAIDRVASYLRYSLDNLNKIIPLQKEFDNIDDYFSILKQRFGARISMKLEHDSGCANALVPAMILQPLVENSCKHGIPMLRENARIELCGALENDTVRVTVTDNGQGMTEQTINELYRRIQTGGRYSDSSGIGIPNIVQRIEHLLNCKVRLEISSIPFVKTSVTLVIPYRVKMSQNGGTDETASCG